MSYVFYVKITRAILVLSNNYQLVDEPTLIKKKLSVTFYVLSFSLLNTFKPFL